MLAAWKWIKWIGLGLLIITVVVTGFALKASNADKTRLNEKLNQAKEDNQSNLKTIATLSQDNAEANQILVDRQRQHQLERGRLNADMEQFRKAMEGVECVVPRDITERLREPY